jgi:hypothetical protein
MVRGELSEERLPSGVTRFTSKEFPALPEDELRAVGLRVQRRLAAGG